MKYHLPLAALTALLLPLALRAADPPPSGEKYALLVGVSRYVSKELRPLPYSERDVTDLAQVLRASGYRADNVVLLTQSAGARDPRFSPLAERVRAELALLLKNRRPGDTVLVAFAGHGLHFQGDADNYFCPADADLQDRKNLLSLGEVYKQLEGCKAGFKLLLVDACRNDPFQDHSRAPKEFDGQSVTRPKLTQPPGGVVAFFSCSEAEKAFENDELKHGVFFHFVIEALKGAAAPGGDEVTLGALCDYVSRRVADFVRAKYGRAQTPELFGKLRGTFPLVRLETAVRRAQEHLAQGDTWYAKREYEKALAEYTQALRINPKSTLAFFSRGLVWQAKREYDQALADYTEVLRLDPTNALAFNNRGNTWRDKHELDKALDDLNEALRLAPRFALAFNNRGNVWYDKQEYDRALDDYTQALRLDPAYALALRNRGNVWCAKKEYDRALTDYTQAIRLSPRDANLYRARGDVYYALGVYDKAQADYDEARRLRSQ
jgi:tetratricopeptide (TPR) repeat protein